VTACRTVSQDTKLCSTIGTSAYAGWCFRELGVNAEDVMRQQLQQYPLDQQRQLASGARAFVDHFR